jgi:hypothetical protein
MKRRLSPVLSLENRSDLRGAHERDRTADLVLTKDVLYRLSYVSADLFGAGNGIRTRDPELGRLVL